MISIDNTPQLMLYSLYCAMYLVIVASTVVMKIYSGKRRPARGGVMMSSYRVKGFRDLRVIFFENEPFFVYGGRSAKKVEINFIYKFALVIERGNPGWRVVSQGLKAPVDSIYYQYIHNMVEKINAAVEGNSNFGVGDYLLAYNHKCWHDLEYPHRLIQVIDGDISPFPPEPDSKRLFLTYQNGRPIFFQRQRIGTVLSISFGKAVWQFNGSEGELVTFRLALSMEDNVWKLALTKVFDRRYYDWFKNPLGKSGQDWTRDVTEVLDYYMKQKENVESMIRECNEALANRAAMDFDKWQTMWQNFDNEFTFEVGDFNTLIPEDLIPALPPLSQKKMMAVHNSLNSNSQ